jgi:CheY-like chemotaxis protein
MNGIDAVSELRKLGDKKKANTPVIAITGNAANHSVDYLKSVGFTEYLQKPLNFDHLVELVKKYSGE